MKRSILFLVLLLQILSVKSYVGDELLLKINNIVNSPRLVKQEQKIDLDVIVYHKASSEAQCLEQLKAEDCDSIRAEGTDPCSQLSDAVFIKDPQDPENGSCYVDIKGTFRLANLQNLVALDEEPTVNSIDLNGKVEMADCSTQKKAPYGLCRVSNWKLRNGHFRYVPNAGEGVKVYVLDSGICKTCENSEEFQGRITGKVSFNDNSDSVYDVTGHGTHVSGTIAGNTYGIARSAEIVSVKVFHKGGASYITILKGLSWIQRQCASADARCVINASLDGPKAGWFNEAWTLVAQGGIPTIVAAGNAGVDAKDRSPASAEGVITVGAVDSKFKRAGFSNYGSFVDIFAPGVDTLSMSLKPPTAVKKSGTSMAAPHVAGVVAYLVGRENKKMVKKEVMEYLNARAVNKVEDSRSRHRKFLQQGSCGSLDVVKLANRGEKVTLDIGAKEFNALFRACPVVQYTRNREVHSVYHRTSPLPAKFNAYSIFTGTWKSKNNVLGRDFNIYDNTDKLRAGSEAWAFCNYNDKDVGYPRDCGKNGWVSQQWFSMPGGRFYAAGLTKGASFRMFREADCPRSRSVTAVLLSRKGGEIVTTIGKQAFNDLFRACPIVQYTRNGEVHSVYHRTSPIPAKFNAYSIFTTRWNNNNNVLGRDFNIYDNTDKLRAGSEAWSFCNYNNNDKGYPRECGKNGRVKRQWFSMPGGKFNAPDLSKGASFQLFKAEDCPA